jgi:hypothetical protein
VSGRELRSQFQRLDQLVAAAEGELINGGEELHDDAESGGPDDPIESEHRRMDAAGFVGGDGGMGRAGPVGQAAEREPGACASTSDDGCAVHSSMVSDSIPIVASPISWQEP